MLPKIIVICGPTASGKSELAVNLAKKFNGEIVSADSRQIYRGMNIGTAKVPLDAKGFYKDIKHHLIDILDPVDLFSVVEYKKLAIETINKIIKLGKVPFLVGGAGLYIKAVTDNLEIPAVKPNQAIRKKLENKSESELFKMIENIDPETAQFIDKKNKRRLVRALEVFLVSGRKFSSLRNQGSPLFESLKIAPEIPKPALLKNIKKRVQMMIEQGLELEVKNLLEKFGWTPVLSQTISYQEWLFYFEKKLSLEETIEQIIKNTRHYAKRQLTWFKADPKIHWIKSESTGADLIQKFI